MNYLCVGILLIMTDTAITNCRISPTNCFITEVPDVFAAMTIVYRRDAEYKNQPSPCV